ncbi:SDR family NAD(P)-dependent oxidoreductase [Bacillus massiliigorillae]|uniref:SDR family NAD(P)-dependent oxidoreductase n=1 Tax=Bacillus massiliigorillae TaxID=1243664 RepID=UPI0005A5D93F|nr:SDR family oxidoreductase [Bacillus massiliigorillae]
MNRLHNKTVVVTGASSGLGKEIAIQSAKSGANVVLIARSMNRLKELEQTLVNQFGVKVYSFQLDVSDASELERVFTDIVHKVGNIDVLVNNAGFGIFEEAREMDLEETKRMLDVNVFGLMASTRMAIDTMIERQSGHIINIASQAGKVATPKSSVYAATKHAVLGFSNALRLELAEHHVFVTTVNPGPIETNFFETADTSGTYVKNVKKYMLRPEEVAAKVVSCMLTNKREINLPGWMNAGAVFYAVFPRMFEALGQKFFFKK